MRRSLSMLMVCLLGMVAGCAGAAAVSSSEGGGFPALPAAAAQHQPSPAVVVPQLLAEVEELPHLGGTIDARNKLAEARSYAGADPALIASVARVALEWDWQTALRYAQDAVAANSGSSQAQLALGLVLFRMGKYEEARPHLQQAYDAGGHNLEAGYRLAIALESMQQMEAAGALLRELRDRFPDRPELSQSLVRLDSLLARWPMPGTAGTPVADWAPDHWWATRNLLVGMHKDEQTLEAIGRDGAARWQLICGGKLVDMVFDQEKERAIYFAAKQSCLIDLRSGDVLARGPGLQHDVLLDGFAWRGDWVALGEDIPPPAGMPTSVYAGSNWHVYRLPQGGASMRQVYVAANGSRRAALSRDGRLLFSWFGNHGAGRPRLFRDGELVTSYEHLPVGGEFALDPRDDRFYFVSYLGFMQARTLEGKLLWQVDAAKYGRPVLAPTTDGAVTIAVQSEDEVSSLYSDDGTRLWSGAGFPGLSSSQGVSVFTNDDVNLIDRHGKVVALYPPGTGLTRDGQAMFRAVGGWIDLYTLGPQS